MKYVWYGLAAIVAAIGVVEALQIRYDRQKYTKAWEAYNANELW